MNKSVMLKFRGQVITAYIVKQRLFMSLYKFVDIHGKDYLEWRPTWRSIEVKIVEE